ncbi:MAG: CBS domain-containing protein [Candidatus Saccharimonas sp.]
MQTVLFIGFFLTTVLLTLLASMMPRREVLSTFELERRRSQGNESAAEALAREVMLDDVMSLKHAAEATLLVVVVVLGVGAWGIWLGMLISIAIALWYGRAARIEFVHGWAMRIYEQWEQPVLRFVERVPTFIKLLRTINQAIPEPEISSREELEHLVEQAGHILTDDERKRITNGLNFGEKRVESIMTPRGVVETIPKNELVGPVLLDELHRTGHSRFPVIDGDIDHVVGVLHIKELLTLGDKETKTAAKAMESHVFYINQDQTLDHALAAFIKTRHHLFIVVNGYRETAGILTLEDVMEALLGKEIVDEYDVHDDLRIVAARTAKENNNPPHATNI